MNDALVVGLVAAGAVTWIIGMFASIGPVVDNRHPWGIGAVFFWPLALAWAGIQRAIPVVAGWSPSEEGRLRRQIARVQKERDLLHLRAELEREQEAYRADFDRYVSGEPTPQQRRVR